LAPCSVDEVIRREIDRFASEGRTFEWKWFDHDRPPDVPSRLRAHGFIAGPHEGLRVLDVAATGARQGASTRLRTTVGGVESFAAATAVLHEVWPANAPKWTDDLRASIDARPELIRIALAFDDAPEEGVDPGLSPYGDPAPVACGFVRLPKEGSTFAYAFAGAVRASWRGLGAYRQVVMARAREVAVSGGRYLIVDTSDMSDPVLEHLGFTLLGGSTPWTWTPT